MAEFAYNMAKNASTGYQYLELNYGYYLRIFYEDETNPYSKSRSTNKLAKELKDLIAFYQQNLFHA